MNKHIHISPVDVTTNAPVVDVIALATPTVPSIALYDQILGRAEAARDASKAIYRAHDVTTEWQGPARSCLDVAQRDADRHNDGCASQGGYGSAEVVVREGDRCVHLNGATVWPPHGRSCGAARWR